jgi:choline-sulfatase
VRIPKEDLDPHSQRLMRVCDLWDKDFSDDQIRRARRAYYGAVSYVDDCIGRLLEVLADCGLDKNTIVVFAGDHGDMLGERGLWYKMSYFENSARVPLLIHDPRVAAAAGGEAQALSPYHRRVSQNVSTLDLLPTLVDLVGAKLWPDLPMDGTSLLPHLRGAPGGPDTVIGEYTGEGTVQPLFMIRRGKWKFVTCPADGVQLYDLERDPLELVDLAKKQQQGAGAGEAAAVLAAFIKEADARWDYEAIRQRVLLSQRQRRMVWSALRVGRFESWDHNPSHDDGRLK